MVAGIVVYGFAGVVLLLFPSVTVLSFQDSEDDEIREITCEKKHLLAFGMA
jgi:hypothetical protein